MDQTTRDEVLFFTGIFAGALLAAASIATVCTAFAMMIHYNF